MRSVVTAISLAVLVALFPLPALAGNSAREIEVKVEKTAYIWVIGSWNFETCRILTDSFDDIPQYADISALCGVETTRMMNEGIVDLYYLGKYVYQTTITQPLPQIEIQSEVAWDKIIVQAVDPLPDHSVIQIDASFNGSPAVCDTVTGTEIPGGLRCEFEYYYKEFLFTAFAVSSFGDQSKNIQLRIGNSTSDNSYFWDTENQLEIIGDNAYTQYNSFMDIPRVWGTVPGNDTVPDWLKIVPNKYLQTSQRYYYLGGQILLGTPLAGQICPNNGVNGQYGTPCGVSAVFDQIVEYQNAYNGEITLAGRKTGVPNSLIKRIIAVESQFYPNALGIAGETGLYQLTRDGADTLFRWNGPFYVEHCNEYWDYCDRIGYDNLESWQRDVLINHVLADPNNLYYLGSTLKANAYQIKRLLWEVNRIDNPGEIISYVDLWKITVLNYHAGATLTSAILVNIRELGLEVSWESFASVLSDLQHSGLRYVNRVAGGY